MLRDETRVVELECIIRDMRTVLVILAERAKAKGNHERSDTYEGAVYLFDMVMKDCNIAP